MTALVGFVIGFACGMILTIVAAALAEWRERRE